MALEFKYDNIYSKTMISILDEILHSSYCKLVIICHVPIFAIFVSVRNNEFTYWRI